MPRNGSIYKRERSPVWYIRYRDENGRLVRRSSGTEVEDEAVRVLHEAEKSVERRRSFGGALSYQAAAVAYITSLSKKQTIRQFTRSLRYWDPIIGHLYMDEITVDHVNEYIELRRSAGVADSTVLSEVTYLSALFSWHGRDDVSNNPVKAARVWKRLKGAKEITRFLTPEEEAAILAELPDPLHRMMVQFAIETGLRKFEQLDLTCRRVDTERREITLFEDQTKDKEPRIVPMSQLATGIALELKIKNPDANLFRSARSGRFRDVHWFWYPALRRSGVQCRWHDLRHTFATRWLQDGGEVSVLQKILGHANVMTTMRYGHVVTGTMHHQMAQIDARRAKDKTHT